MKGGGGLQESLWMQLSDYFSNHMLTFLNSWRQHLEISLLALLGSTLIGITLGTLSTKYGRSEKWILSLFQTLRIVPSLAILLLLLPIMGTGIRPALVALIILGIPPILMNTISGLQSVSMSLLESAQGVGMSERQIRWKIQFPVAGPLILTGIKTAAIEIIASATLAAKIGAGGLGEIIFIGLGLNRTDLLLIGGISVAILAIGIGFILDLSERVLFRYKFLQR